MQTIIYIISYLKKQSISLREKNHKTKHNLSTRQVYLMGPRNASRKFQGSPISVYCRHKTSKMSLFHFSTLLPDPFSI